MQTAAVVSIVLFLVGGMGFRLQATSDDVPTEAVKEGRRDDADRRIVTVLAVADASYRSQFPEWHARIQGIVSAVSARYEDAVSITLQLSEARKWPFHASLEKTDELTHELFRVAPNDADIVIAFVKKTPTVLMRPGEHTDSRLRHWMLSASSVCGAA